MEYEPSFDLLWVEDPPTECPMCQGQILVQDVTLTLDGWEPLEYDWPLGRCVQCGQWYGLLSDLLGELMEQASSPTEVDGFLLNGAPVRAGLWVDLPLGAMPWEVFREYVLQQESRLTGPPPDPEEVRALPLLSEAWELALRPAAWYFDEEGQQAPSYIALLLDPTAGIRNHDLKGETPHAVDDLFRLVLEAAVHPQAGAPGRPLEILLDQRALANALNDALSAVDISVRSAPTPDADAVLDDMLRTVGGAAEAPFFATYEEETIRAFFQTAQGFFQTRPWERIAEDKYVAFCFEDGPWQYLSVIGQMGEEYGVSLFDDWIQLCRLIHNQPTMIDFLLGESVDIGLDAAGAMEGLSLDTLDNLHPEDAAYFERLGLKPVYDALYPSVRRFTLEGLETPRRSLQEYEALLEALTKAIRQRRALRITSIKQTLDAGETAVTFRYPARGDEAFEDKATNSYRLVIAGVDARGETKPRRLRIEIDASGETGLDEVAAAIRKEGGYSYFVTAFLSEDYAVWSSQSRRGDPCPRVAHLAGLPEPALEFVDDAYPLEILPRMGAASSALQVRFVAA